MRHETTIRVDFSRYHDLVIFSEIRFSRVATLVMEFKKQFVLFTDIFLISYETFDAKTIMKFNASAHDIWYTYRYLAYLLTLTISMKNR